MTDVLRPGGVAIAVLAVLAACGEAGPAPVRGGTAVYVQAGAPAGANALVNVDTYSDQMNRHLLFLPLVAFDAALELEPRLAERWDWDGDTAIVFRLRRDIRWSDGRATTAHDVAFTLARALEPATGYPGAGNIAHLHDPQVVDSFTIRIGVDPVRDPLTGLALLPVLPAHVLDTVAPERLRTTAFNLSPVTNGPFGVVEARPPERWIFARNDSFPEALGGPPHLDRLVWRAVPESDAQLIELQAGEAHILAGVRADGFDRVRQRDDVESLERPTLSYIGVAWNGRRPPLDDARVRRALTLGIDRRQILDGLRGGYGTVADGPIPPGHWAASALPEPLPHDPAGARRLLEEAGLMDRDGDGEREDADGRRLRLRLVVVAGNDFNRDVAQVIQSQLASLGAAIALRPLEWGTLIQTITGPDRDFDAVLIGLDAEPRLDLRGLFHSEALDGPLQVAGYGNPQLDSVLNALDRTPDRADAGGLFARAGEILREEQPWTYLYFATDLILFRDRLRGVDADLRGLLHSAPDWWLEGSEE